MLRVLGPPEDLVRGIFHGSDGGATQQRKARELEKKRAYAAELQAQMQEKERQKQLERMQRLGVPQPGSLGSSLQEGAAPANFAAPQPAGMLNSESSAWPAQAANPQQSSPVMYQQQSPGQPMGAAAAAAPSGCYNQGGGCGQSPQVAPGAGQSAYSSQQQQQLLQPLAAWPDNVPGGGGAISQYMMQQQQHLQQQQYQQQQQPGMPGQQGPGACGTYQQPQQPYMAMSVAAQHAADTGSPSTAYYSSSPQQQGLYGPPGGQQTMAAAAGAQSWGAQAAGTYSAGPPSGEVMHSMGSNSSIGRPGYGAPGMSPGHGYWGPRGMGSSVNHAWGSGPAAEAAAAPDAKALAAKAKKDAYRAELEAQIRDKAARKAAEKSAMAAEEARKEAELAGYNPWGRGGAGAPLRDANGQIVSDLRGRRGQEGLSQQMQQQPQQQQQQYQQAAAYAYNNQGTTAAAGQAAAAAGVAGPSSSGAVDEQFSSPDRFQQQQQQQQGFAAAAAGPGAGAPPGAPPLLCFRSDKAFMTADEVERKQQAQRELQKELDQQIQEKKRRKELEQRQAAEEAQKGEQRLAAEQAKLAAQFEDEQMKQRPKTRMTEDIEDAVAGAWTAAKHAAEQERQKSMDVHRRSQAQLPAEESSGSLQQASSFHQSSRQPASQPSRGRDNSGLSGQQQQPDMLQFQVQQRRQQLQMDQQQRQQLMLEALRLEEEKMRQMAAQEVERLRSEMQAQASALRDVMERQGGEVATLRAAAAAAEAESQAAKMELAQVRRDFLRKSQELQHETLSTILADYGDGPVSSMAAAYHPSPIRRIELDLPPHAATARRSAQARAVAGGLAAAGGGTAGYTAPAAAAAEFGNLAGGQSAVEVLESLLQQGKQPPTGGLANHGGVGGADGAGNLHGNLAASWGVPLGRRASMPIATAAPVANGVSGPSWLANAAVGKSTANVRSSMLVSESTFIFPSGLAPPAQAVDEDGNVMEYVGTFESMEDAAAAAAAPPGMEGSSWGVWQQQQQPLQHYQRQTSSAPGSSNAGRAAASGLQPSLSAGRHGLVTPGGSDLTAVVTRNADKLQLLSSMPAPGDPAALDEFLAKFVNKSSQPNHRTVATPPSRLMTPPTGSLQLPSRHPSNNSRSLPPRYSNSAADTATATAAAAAGNRNDNAGLYLGISDTPNIVMSRMSMDAAGGGSSAAAVAAQQRLLSVGGAGGNSYRGAAAADGSGAAVEQKQQQHVENSDVSLLGTSQWVQSNGSNEP